MQTPSKLGMPLRIKTGFSCSQELKVIRPSSQHLWLSPSKSEHITTLQPWELGIRFSSVKKTSIEVLLAEFKLRSSRQKSLIHKNYWEWPTDSFSLPEVRSLLSGGGWSCFRWPRCCPPRFRRTVGWKQVRLDESLLVTVKRQNDSFQSLNLSSK